MLLLGWMYGFDSGQTLELNKAMKLIKWRWKRSRNRRKVNYFITRSPLPQHIFILISKRKAIKKYANEE